MASIANAQSRLDAADMETRRLRHLLGTIAEQVAQLDQVLTGMEAKAERKACSPPCYCIRPPLHVEAVGRMATEPHQVPQPGVMIC